MAEKMRKDLTYKVFCTGRGIYKIGAVINQNEVVHSGNLHFLDGYYTSNEEALTALETMLKKEVSSS